MKRLFMISHKRDNVRRKLNRKPEYFDNKMLAKDRRDELNHNGDKYRGFFVTKGPDHPGNHGGGTRHPRMRRNANREI